MKKNNIEDLVEKTKENDEEAFESLYRHFYPKLYATAFRLCRNDADAKDAVQMTFIQARQSIHSLQQNEYFPFWINRIVSNKCKNIFRYNHDNLFDDEYFRVSNMFVEKHRDANAESFTHFQSDKETLAKLISELSKDQQEVLEYTYFKQMNNEEAAHALSVPVGTIKSRLYTARKTLQQKIERYEQKENVHLDFKAEAIGTAFVLLALKKQLAIPVSLPFFQTLKQKLSSSTLTTTITKVCLASLCGVAGIGGGIYVYQRLQERNLTKNAFESNETIQPTITNSFPKLEAMEIKVSSPQDAYYFLRGWAYDEAAMQKKSKEQIQEAKPIYHALKSQGGLYLELLETSGWTKSFEQLTDF